MVIIHNRHVNRRFMLHFRRATLGNKERRLMKITTSKDELDLELHGQEQLWSLRAKIRVPIETIIDISFNEVFQDWCKWQIRMPGTGAPHLLMAGSYWTEEGWDFLYAKRPAGFYKPKLTDVLVIVTSQNRYRRIILSITREESDKIISWWRKAQKSKRIEKKA